MRTAAIHWLYRPTTPEVCLRSHSCKYLSFSVIILRLALYAVPGSLLMKMGCPLKGHRA